MAPELRANEVHIRVPASSANLGSAFDSAGLGLEIYDNIFAQITQERGVHVDVSGVGAGELPTNCDHLVAKAMKIGFDALGVRPAGFAIRCHNHISHGQGLGSSAAAIIGGLAAARALVVDGDSLMSDHDLLTLALQLESHPDNLSASLFGGFTIAWVTDEGRAECVNAQPHDDIRLTLCVPSGIAPTDQARAVLPDEIPLTDAIVNIGSSALLHHAITSQPALLLAATRDAIHQDRRREMFGPSLAILHDLRSRHFPAVISGAGPAILVFDEHSRVCAVVTDPDWQVLPVGVARQGVHVVTQKDA
jgi:homoserine kinase